MTKLITVMGRNSFFNYVAQSNYWIIEAKLLKTVFKNNSETKESRKFVKTYKWFLLIKLKKKDC